MTALIKVLICEDEPLARETLRDFIHEQPQLLLVGEAGDGAQALKLIRALQPDLVFMDIQMPELTGLEVVRQLVVVPPLIFTTAYDQHAVTAFELNAVDYLLKPFTQERAQAAHSALASDGPLTRILVRDRGRIFPVAVADIEHLRSDLKYTQITAKGASYLVRMALTDLEARLDPQRFLRVHRNAIVNLDFVQSMKPDEQSQLQILMHDGTELLANREASKQLRDLSI